MHEKDPVKAGQARPGTPRIPEFPGVLGGTGVFWQQKVLDIEFSLCVILLIGAGRQGMARSSWGLQAVLSQARATCCPSVASLNVARYIPGDGGQQPY